MDSHAIDINSEFIITILAFSHGTLIETNLSPERADYTSNTRMFSLADRFDCVDLSPELFIQFASSIFQKFRNPISGSSTRKIMNDLCLDITSKYKREPQETCKNIHENISIDKRFTIVEDWQPVNKLNGAYLVAIHVKNGDSIEQLYPSTPSSRINILELLSSENLFNIATLSKFASFFHKSLNEISIPNTKFPNIDEHVTNAQQLLDIFYQDSVSEDNIEIDKKARKNDYFTKLVPIWEAELNHDGTKIMKIRLSQFLHIIKQIVGPSCRINLFDFSCNNESFYSGYKTFESRFFKPTSESDIEMGHIPLDFGGKIKFKKRQTKRLQTKRRTNRKTKRDVRKLIRKHGKKYNRKHIKVSK